MRDSGSNANTKIYFEVRATNLRLRLHTKGFPLCPHKIFHKGTSTEELQQLYTSLSTNTSTQEARHKAKGKKKFTT